MLVPPSALTLGSRRSRPFYANAVPRPIDRPKGHRPGKDAGALRAAFERRLHLLVEIPTITDAMPYPARTE